MRRAAVFPDVAVKMIEVGESTGALQDMLNSLADFYDEEIETELDRFVTLIEPVLLVIMGVVIAASVLALYHAAVPADRRWCVDGDQDDRERSTQTWRRAVDASADHAGRGSATRAGWPSGIGSSSSTWTQFRIDQELFRSIPADLMLRYGFVPYRREGKALVIVVSDPTRPADDRRAVACCSARRSRSRSARASAIQSILKKSESSQRVLDEATEGFQLQLLKEDETRRGEPHRRPAHERHQPDHQAGRLDDLHRHPAARQRHPHRDADDEVHVKYRIDGVLQPAMRPIDKQFHSPIISRIKVMAELDIAEKRVPQDGRFKLRVPGKTIDFRVSIMPSVHGEDAVIRILDKESISEQFTELRLDILGFAGAGAEALPQVHRASRTAWCWSPGPTGTGKTTTLYAALSRDQDRRGQDHHHRGPGRVPAARHHADPGQREEGADLRARPALDPAPRPGQDHGRRDPRPGDGADRHPVGAHRPPRVHDRPRQQRRRRARPLPEHGRRAVPLRLGAQLRAGAAAGAR